MLKKALATICGVSLAILLWHFVRDYQIPRRHVYFLPKFAQQDSGNDQRDCESAAPPIVFLFWTTFFRNKQVFLGPFDFTQSCNRPHGQCCETTLNRSRIDEANVVLFHALDFDVNDLPARRDSEQIYAFVIFESPRTNVIDGHHFPKGFFNRTLTYRLDSDFPLTSSWLPIGASGRLRSLPSIGAE